jgi:hypothetical protein
VPWKTIFLRSVEVFPPAVMIADYAVSQLLTAQRHELGRHQVYVADG